MGAQTFYRSTFFIFLLSIVFFEPVACCLSSQTWAYRTRAAMSLREKIGQLCIVAISFSDDAQELLASNYKKMKFPYMYRAYVENLITKYQVGGIIFLRKSEVQKQVHLTNELQQMSKLPLLVMEDLEWGLAMRLDNTIKFPRNLTLGALRNEELVYRIAQEIGRQCKAIGVHMNLAPVVDINNNAANPVISDRSFGQDKERVATLGLLCMQGLQDAGILACAKHFPGHGDTDIDSHVTVPHLKHTKKRLQNMEIYPFKRLIAGGVAAVMNGHLKVTAYDPQNIATFSRSIVTDLLQKKLGFNGLILTDALNMGALGAYTPEEIAIRAIRAGNDLLVVPLDVPKTVAGIEAAVRTGKISEQEIDARVLKVLQAKERLKLHENRFVAERGIEKIVATPYAYQLKRRAYQEAITIVHDTKGVIPVRGQRIIPVVQIGGQKKSQFVETLCAHTPCTIRYLPAAMRATEVQEQVEKLGNAPIVVVGLFDMNKFAHKKFGISAGTLAFLKAVRLQHKKVVIVLFGSPYSVSLFDVQDTLVVAYEDDPDAQEAAAEVVVGERRAVGQLPICL